MSSVSLAGSLEDLGLNDILQILSLSRKSGILRLSSGDQGLDLYIAGGDVVAARPHPSIAALHTYFRDQGVLDEAQLAEFAEVLKNKAFRPEPWTRFWGGVFGVGEAAAGEWAEGYLIWLVARAGSWSDGDFSFELDPEGSALGKVRKVPVFPSVEKGMSAQFLAMESARVQDESNADLGARSSEIPDGEMTITDVMPEHAAAGAEAAGTAAESGPATQQAEAEPAEAEPADAPAATGPERILFVDVKPDTGNLIAEALRARGFPQVATAHGVEAAYETIERAEQGDWTVVSELVMPKRDRSGVLGGLEVANELVGHPRVAAVYLCSDLINEEIEAQGGEAGVAGFIDKPPRKAWKTDAKRAVGRYVRDMVAAIGEPPAGDAETDAPAPAAPVSKGHEALEISMDDPLAALLREDSSGFTGPQPRTDRGVSLLRHMIEELTNPNAESEVSLLILRFAADFFQRAIFFAVVDESLTGLGEVGLNIDNADQMVRGLKIPLGEGSAFDFVRDERQPFLGKPSEHPVHSRLFQRLGGTVPQEIYVAPVLAGGRIVAMLYADQVPTQTRIRDAETVEVFLAQAGLALERAYLLKQIREYDNREKGA